MYAGCRVKGVGCKVSGVGIRGYVGEVGAPHFKRAADRV